MQASNTDPAALEAGLDDVSKPLETPAAAKLVRDSSSSRPSNIPSELRQPREPELKDVWDKWRGRPSKQKRSYAPPPRKEERSELETFQNLVGIHFLRPGGGLLWPEDQGAKPASPMHDIFVPTKAAARRWRNRGLYDRTLSQDLRNRVLYGMSNYVISFLYLLQILIAAALTGLSAYQQSSSVVLTTLGAINTVLAGILAWLNGQGMPIRFRRARDQYREVVRAIEDTERTFAEIDYIDWAPGTRPNPYAERDRLEQMYEEARQDQERNYPDVQEGPNKDQMEGEAKQLRETISDEKAKKSAFSKTLEKTRDDHKQQLKNLEKHFAEKIKNAVEEQKDRIRTEVEYKHLQKVAEEQKRKFEKEKAEIEDRPCVHERPRDGPRQPGEQDGRVATIPDRPRQVDKPRERPSEGPPSAPRDAPRERSPARPRGTSPPKTPAAPQTKSTGKSSARSAATSPVRSASPPAPRPTLRPGDDSPARPSRRSPVRSPRDSPARPSARSTSSSPPPARSPSGGRSRSPSNSPSRPAASPERRPAGQVPSEQPGPRGSGGPPGLFTNTGPHPGFRQ
ncbi:hypothetical protein WHR41_06259 [Cladosporium halotolerans]|uniref:SMODS and SLOG-associating 2TM effector domain-containing protein n=1 Tax=Cladosporium halotolerans TaxID=1052096 RepID=A0AB34KHZ2_9PEZI